jgi:hypothetical protein
VLDEATAKPLTEFNIGESGIGEADIGEEAPDNR